MKDDFLKMLLYAEDMGRLGYRYRPTVKERTGFTQEELNVCPPPFDWQVVADAIATEVKKGNDTAQPDDGNQRKTHPHSARGQTCGPDCHQ